MDRKEFLRKGLLGLTGVGALPFIGRERKESAEPEQVGFNHLPTKEIKTMNTVLHKAETRGHANHGWLDTHHTFSFAGYHNPERMHFGALRVLNDDRVAGGAGFGKHPHDNMEIISIPLEGALEHQDSMGNTHVIRKHDVQIMSAGTGIFHAEKNKAENEEVKFLQIWVFPKERDIEPRYAQEAYRPKDRQDQLQLVVSPAGQEGLDINQNAWFSLGTLSAGKQVQYEFRGSDTGVYAFVIDGKVTIDEQALHPRDGFGVWGARSLDITADTDAEILLMEVPMKW